MYLIFNQRPPKQQLNTCDIKINSDKDRGINFLIFTFCPQQTSSEDTNNSMINPEKNIKKHIVNYGTFR